MNFNHRREWIQNRLLNLEKSLGSRKSTQALGALDKLSKSLITNKVTTRSESSPCTPISYVSFSRPSDFSRLKLGGIFAADLYAFAVMHNHYHVVLFMDVERASQWTDDEVATRWLTLCPPRMAVNNNPEAPEQAECFTTFVESLAAAKEKIALYRKRPATFPG